MTLDERCLSLVSTWDLEALQERVLQHLCELSGAQSGALWVASEQSGLRLRAFRGLADKTTLPELVDPSLVQSATWRAGQSLLVPLIAQGGEVQGLVQLAEAISGNFNDAHLADAQHLAPFAAVALTHAKRLTLLQRQGLRDRETGAYTLSYFTDYASKEIYKAQRYSRAFSLLTFGIDNLAQLRSRLGAAAARQAQRLVLKVLSDIIRDADVVARASEQEFHVLLPETDYFGGHMFLRRAFGAVYSDADARAMQARVPLGLTCGVATYPKDGEDFDELLVRCRLRMEERRGSLHHQLRLYTMPFWDAVELLLGTPKSPRLPETGGEPARRGKVADLLFDELQLEVAQELRRDPSSRGLLYVGAGALDVSLPIVRALDEAGSDFGPRVYVLGRRGDLPSHPVVTPVFLEGDERLSRHEFLLWLGDGAAYALLQRRGRGATWGFHTSDATTVEGLISKLQAEYDLQPY